jgi:hypothetical protein
MNILVDFIVSIVIPLDVIFMIIDPKFIFRNLKNQL